MIPSVFLNLSGTDYFLTPEYTFKTTIWALSKGEKNHQISFALISTQLQNLPFAGPN